jgi:hypothetical protein
MVAEGPSYSGLIKVLLIVLVLKFLHFHLKLSKSPFIIYHAYNWG